MIDSKTIKIREGIREQCKKIIPHTPKETAERNNKIIQWAMDTYGISRKEAFHNFIHNNDWED